MNAIKSRCKKLGQLVLTFLCNHKRTILEAFSVVALIVFMTMSIERCSYYKDTNSKNIIALTDSIRYYKGKYGQEIATKTIAISNYKNLKLINDSLYRIIESMKVNGKPDIVVGTSITIDNGKKDTVWLTSSSYSSIYYKRFDFGNRYRKLNGYVKGNKDSVKLSIDEDIVMFKYALAIKDNQVYMTSDNPYVKFNNITGLKIPERERKKKFGLGPSIFMGYGNKGFNYGIGIGLQYKLFEF